MKILAIVQVVVFIIGTVFLVIMSRKSLGNTGIHGFYRFFVFEFALCLVLLNIPYWFINPFSFQQMISWIFLLVSIYLIIESVSFLKKYGMSGRREEHSFNYDFENTVNLVKEGVYKYIRHPMYSSLLFLSLGALFKNISIITIGLSFIIILFLILTAKVEEKEDINFFGNSYQVYMKDTKMFIPYLF
jgi:protein-S-isoprenylcysteine O-methyltransferase Ste14